ncbi:hypothetical protein HDU67_004619, partial [Dinochytrium kinnereticum]
LSDLVKGRYSDLCDELHIIDCRYPYEYEGGHIVGARNVYTTADLSSVFYPTLPGCSSKAVNADKKVVIVFHCEFSVQRAPRILNMDRYPLLDYPHIYVLQGGYRSFHAEHEDECEPRAYVEMRDERFRDELRRHTTQMR